VLGVKEEAGRSIVETLAATFGDRRLLVVLDNCEHVLPACAEAATALLRAVPQMKILATSREPLRVMGETVYSLPALGTPSPAQGVEAAALAQFPAVRLFMDRGVAVQPDFRITEQNAPYVVDICHRLDGIPLAIELAAARVRALSVQSIAERLNDRFRLLTGGDRTALPRQRTLRALIDWSYDLLTPDESALFRRIAVFAGSFPLEAAEAVGAGGDIEVAGVLDLLSRLVEKSLVAVDLDSARYRLLDTVRQYASERLAESGDADDAQGRHLEFYLALAEQARPLLVGPQQASWLARLDSERENLLSAHASCQHVDNGAEKGLRLVYAIKPYWLNRGLLGLGYAITTEALARAGAQARSRARCGGLADAGQLGFFVGRYAEAQSLLEESLSIARELGDKKLVEAVLQPLGMACLGRGDVDSARKHLTEALALARELGNKRELAGALNALAQLHRMEGDQNAAEPIYGDVVAIGRELKDREIVAIGLLNLAMVSIGRGATTPARGMLLEVLDIATEIGSKPAEQSVFEVATGLAASCGDWIAAARFYGIAEAQAGKTGLRRDPTDEAFLAPHVGKAREALGVEAFNKAQGECAIQSYDSALAEVRGWLDRLR
jgi:non-specific serine/threonine protein kinase